MKNFTLLLTLLICFVVTGFTQNSTCSLPAGYSLSQGSQYTTFNNPLNGCSSDCGVVTPGVGGSNPANIIFPPVSVSSSTASITQCFQFFVFDATLKCSSNQDFPCPTYVTGYIVDASYSKTTAPSSSEYYGVSSPQLINAFGQVNCVTVSFTTAPDPNKQYKLFLDFTNPNNCNQQNLKYVILLPSGGPLPLSLSSFLVGRTGSSISLNWKMESGINVSNFEVERSFDNVAYKSIASVAGNGLSSTSSTQSYSYVDNTNNSKSVSFYRLKIVKQGGEISYSDIKTVKGFGGKAEFILFPNPSFGNARITITDISEPTTVQVLDNSGRLIKSLLLNNSNSVQVSGLQRGSYIVRITGTESGTTTVKKLTVIN